MARGGGDDECRGRRRRWCVRGPPSASHRGPCGWGPGRRPPGRGRRGGGPRRWGGRRLQGDPAPSCLVEQRRNWTNGTCRALRHARADPNQVAEVPVHVGLVEIPHLHRGLGLAHRPRRDTTPAACSRVPSPCAPRITGVGPGGRGGPCRLNAPSNPRKWRRERTTHQPARRPAARLTAVAAPGAARLSADRIDPRDRPARNGRGAAAGLAAPRRRGPRAPARTDRHLARSSRIISSTSCSTTGPTTTRAPPTTSFAASAATASSPAKATSGSGSGGWRRPRSTPSPSPPSSRP